MVHLDASGKQVSTASGINETSSRMVNAMGSAFDHVAAVQQLSDFRIGDSIKIFRGVTDSLAGQLESAPKNAPLTISVYQTRGPNISKGVVGLQVSGILRTAKLNYSMLFSAEVHPDEYQFSLDVYGPKRMVATWGNVTVFEQAQVVFKPALMLRPCASYVFHSAKDGSRITARGEVRISSRDDPRSVLTPNSLVFADWSIPYTGGPVKLNKTLPDGVVTVTPAIPGYSTTSSKFMLFGGEYDRTESQVNLSVADLLAGELRVVLSWNLVPEDLDLYCAHNLPGLSTIYFYHKNEGGRTDVHKGRIELDTDARNGKGPETITFTPGASNTYRFFVHNFSNESPIYQSGTSVVVMEGDNVKAKYDVPTSIMVDSDGQAARYWHVLDVVNGRIVPVNEVVFERVNL